MLLIYRCHAYNTYFRNNIISTICHLLLTCYVQFHRTSRLKMELQYFISLVVIFSLNVLFFCAGICLNSLAILTLWKSVQLRKKLCYFMIMVLSCCDLLVVLTNHPFTAVIAGLWLTGKLDVYPKWVGFFFGFTTIFFGFSFFALLVMNFDRYLATYYPIFHRTSVTKRKLLTLFAVLIIVELTLYMMYAYDFFISTIFLLICFIIVFPPTLFINYKLFIIARKSRRNNGTLPEMKKTFSSKKYIQLLAGSRLFCRAIHSSVRLHWTKNKLWIFIDIG